MQPVARPPGRTQCAIVVLCGLAASSCGTGSASRPPFTRYDGTYDGAFAALAGSQACNGTGRSVRFQVSGTHIWSDSRQKHRRLEGTITEAGQLSLVSEDGKRTVSGTIADGRLIATETMPGSGRVRPFAGNALAAPCISQVDASLTVPG